MTPTLSQAIAYLKGHGHTFSGDIVLAELERQSDFIEAILERRTRIRQLTERACRALLACREVNPEFLLGGEDPVERQQCLHAAQDELGTFIDNYRKETP
jgi:hypothetical protein